MNKQEIKSAILKAVGNPEAGAIYENIDLIADAVLGGEEPKETKSFDPVKETRVKDIKETR